MTPNAFIISKLQSFIYDFPQTRVRYEHDKLSDTHFVEVVPNKVYYLNDKYIEWESNMFDEFVKRFPLENIGFISDDAIVGIDHADFELKGIYFEMPYSSDMNNTIIEAKYIEISSFVNSIKIIISMTDISQRII